jgi:hypothetical protein
VEATVVGGDGGDRGGVGAPVAREGDGRVLQLEEGKGESGGPPGRREEVRGVELTVGGIDGDGGLTMWRGEAVAQAPTQTRGQGETGDTG